ncbi:MAG: phage baseplate assembly protein V [Planctomycetota bacterium]|jgi:uncharacterized protein involved in type VI secretion and phage assembly
MEQALVQVARRQQRRYFGKYRGFVADNEDPEQRGRLKLRLPSILGSEVSGWALPCLPFGGLANQGFFLVPDVDAQVWVEFEEGNPDQPIWTGTFWQQSGDPPEEAAKTPPTTRVLRTPSGHVLQFDDAEGEEQIRLHHPTEAELLVDPEGTVSLTDKAGSKLTLDAAGNKAILEDSNGNTLTMDSGGTVIEDANGNKIEMAASGITVKGTRILIEGSAVAVGGQGGEPLIKGTSFLSLFMTHMHTCTAPGSPSSPPIPQGEMSTLTTKTTAM